MASIQFNPEESKSNPVYVKPEKVYYGADTSEKAPIKLQIANGGAGQSGLIGKLANAFIADRIKKTGCDPFAVAWLKSDTAASFNYLAQGSADLSVTYHEAAEEIAMKQGIADRRVYAWRDHFLLAGTNLGRSDKILLYEFWKLSSLMRFGATRSQGQPGKNQIRTWQQDRGALRTAIHGLHRFGPDDPLPHQGG